VTTSKESALSAPFKLTYRHWYTVPILHNLTVTVILSLTTFQDN